MTKPTSETEDYRDYNECPSCLFPGYVVEEDYVADKKTDSIRLVQTYRCPACMTKWIVNT